MLIVNNKQLEVFHKISFEEFVLRMIESIKENFNISDTENNLTDEIKLAIRESERFGFDEEETIEQYLFLKWKYPAFQTYPLSKEVFETLSYPASESEKKIDELINLFEKSNNNFV